MNISRKYVAAGVIGILVLGTTFLQKGVAQTFTGTTTAPTLTANSSPSGKDLVENLRKGGYVLYLRYTKTNQAQADTDTSNLDNISAQRRLTPEGEQQAKALGEAFRALQIPFGTILTSQYNRAKETARLAGFNNAQSSVDLTGLANKSPQEVERRNAALRKMLATAPQKGKNTLLIGHRGNLQSATGTEFFDVGSGEVIVFEPLGEKGYKAVARIPKAETWITWTNKRY